jgi:hypothetical protein
MNIALAIMHIYPNANPLIDFIVQDDSDGNGPYIAAWNIPDPQPTEEELTAAWTAYEAAEAAKPPVLTPEQEIAALKAENNSLLAETARLAARDAQMQDDQMYILEALIGAGIIE